MLQYAVIVSRIFRNLCRVKICCEEGAGAGHGTQILCRSGSTDPVHFRRGSETWTLLLEERALCKQNVPLGHIVSQDQRVQTGKFDLETLLV